MTPAACAIACMTQPLSARPRTPRRRPALRPAPLPDRHRRRRRARLRHQPARPRARPAPPSSTPRQIAKDPFTLGVASGDPLPDSVVLWTRLAPAPVRAGQRTARRSRRRPVGAGPRRALPPDRQARHATAHPEFHHTVHVEVERPRPRPRYYYRFRAGSWISPTGRTRTAPAAGDAARLAALRRRLLPGVPRRLLHRATGTSPRRTSTSSSTSATTSTSTPSTPPAAPATTPTATCPTSSTARRSRWRTTGCGTPSTSPTRTCGPRTPRTPSSSPGTTTRPRTTTRTTSPRTTSRRRSSCCAAPPPTARTGRTSRCAARSSPQGPDMRLYRRLQLRAGSRSSTSSTPASTAPTRRTATAGRRPRPSPRTRRAPCTGATQERWLIDGWRASNALWNVVPQQVVFSQPQARPTAGRYQLSAWTPGTATRPPASGSSTGREAAGVENLMVLTGDVHVRYAFDIKEDFDDPGSRTLGTEIVTTSISSGAGRRRASPPTGQATWPPTRT